MAEKVARKHAQSASSSTLFVLHVEQVRFLFSLFSSVFNGTRGGHEPSLVVTLRTLTHTVNSAIFKEMTSLCVLKQSR